MDENEALTGQGAENAQGEHPNNQTMESLLESESMSVELPQVGDTLGAFARGLPENIEVTFENREQTYDGLQ